MMTSVTQFLKNSFSFFIGNLEVKIPQRAMMYLLRSPSRGALLFLGDEHLSFSTASGDQRRGGKTSGVYRTRGGNHCSLQAGAAQKEHQNPSSRVPVLKPHTIV